MPESEIEIAGSEEKKSPYIHVEQTLAIIKPDAFEKEDEIEEMILRHGFAILQVGGPKFFRAV